MEIVSAAGPDTNADTNRQLLEELAELRHRLAAAEAMVAQRYRGPALPNNPVRESIHMLDAGHDGYKQRLLVATPTTGLVRMEWVDRRMHQIIPTNWSMVDMFQYMNGFIVMRYQVADAQNLIVRAFMQDEIEWLFLLEHDTILPPNGLVLLDEWIQRKTAPVVSGLYFTRSRPSEPLIYRGRGNRFYTDWQMGDAVWCDGVPTGCLLIHRSILAAMWEDAEEYIIEHPDGRREVTRRVFYHPRDSWFNPDTGQFSTITGTTDLHWCDQVIKGDYLRKTGWTALADEKFPFVVDTRLFCSHINQSGEQFP